MVNFSFMTFWIVCITKVAWFRCGALEIAEFGHMQTTCFPFLLTKSPAPSLWWLPEWSFSLSFSTVGGILWLSQSWGHAKSYNPNFAPYRVSSAHTHFVESTAIIWSRWDALIIFFILPNEAFFPPPLHKLHFAPKYITLRMLLVSPFMCILRSQAVLPIKMRPLPCVCSHVCGCKWYCCSILMLHYLPKRLLLNECKRSYTSFEMYSFLKNAWKRRHRLSLCEKSWYGAMDTRRMFPRIRRI